MKKRIAFLVTVLLLMLVAYVFVVFPAQRDERAKENKPVFDRIAGDTQWDMSREMLYGHYFYCSRRFPLTVLSLLLRIVGHREVDIAHDEESKDYLLHVEKVQVHDLNSISTKDVRLRRLGFLMFNTDYDGWDVGPNSVQAKSNETRDPVMPRNEL